MPISAKDAGNFIGGMMLAAGAFAVGNIAVKQILISRRERFQKKGQSKAAIKARETPMDGVFKMVGIALSIYQVSKELPEVVHDVKQLVK